MSSITDTDDHRQFYNRRWESFTYLNSGKLRRATQILQVVADLPLREPRTIELGCGTGWLTGMLGLYGPATGVDLSDSGIEVARGAFPHVRFLAQNALEWVYPKGEFDLVVSHEVIEHVQDQARYLAVARGLLRKGGYLVMTTPNKSIWDARPEGVRKNYDLQPLENWLTRGQLRSLLRNNFIIKRLTTICPTHLATGLRRLPCSIQVTMAARFLGFGDTYQGFLLRIGLGAHLLAVAEAL
jgi:SAM-dependent methyltransferase